MTSKQLTSSTILVSLAFFTAGSPLHPMCNQSLTLEGQLGSGGRQTGDEFQFKDEKGGSGVTKNGNNFSFHSYTSGDGIKLFTYIEDCASVELAKRAVEEKIKEASSVSIRGPKLDKNGKSIGERVVLKVERKVQGEEQSDSLICWTTGSRLHWIQCKSLRHALAFEKSLIP